MASAIVVNADDLGVSRGATLGIVQAHLEGVVTSASLAPTGADYQYAVNTVRKDCPNLGIGLHFTLSAGKPVSSPTDVPLLVDERGYFKWEFVSLFRTLGWKKDGKLLEQIEIELPGGNIAIEHGDRHDSFAPDHQSLRDAHPTARVIVYGHTHRMVIDDDFNPWVVNPGAAGNTRTGDGVSCLMLEASNNKPWTIESIRFSD
jgi:hypothetical protein